MTTQTDRLMALADEYAGRAKLTEEGEQQARAALLAALQEQAPFSPDWADFNNGREVGRMEAREGEAVAWQHKSDPESVITDAQKESNSVGFGEDYLADHTIALCRCEAPQPAQPESETDSMGIPKSCGKPLCTPQNHHPLCRLHEAQPVAQPISESQHFGNFMEWANKQGYDCACTCNSDNGEWLALNPMTADLWKAWKAAHGIGGAR